MAGHRFDLTPILRGHWKGLTDGRTLHPRADWAARALLLSPLGLGVWAYLDGWRLVAATPLVATLGLLTGALMSVFVHLSTLRLRITDRTQHEEDALAPERDLLDQAAAHLLTATLASIVTAVLLAVGLNTTTDHAGAVTGVPAALAIATGSYVVLIFLLVLPLLYGAYVQINNVGTRYNGFFRSRLTR